MEEARQISWNKVDVGEETKDYRVGGIRYQDKKKLNQSDYEYSKELQKAVDKLIRERTGTSKNINIIYHIDCPFDQMEIVSVVLLRNNDFDVVYVFDKTAYILNSEGKTVQKV